MSASPARYTLFPPIPQTVWPTSDTTFHTLAGTLDGNTLHIPANTEGLIVTGPHIDLGPGLYGVEFQLSAAADAFEAADRVALAQITAEDGTRILTETTITMREIAQRFGGMYGGTRLNLILDHPTTGIDFRLSADGSHPFQFHGCKLIPRPGRLWFTEDLDRNPAHWATGPERRGICTEPTLLRGPYVSLLPDSYRVGVKLIAPDNVGTGLIAEMDVVGIPVGSVQAETLVPATPVTAEGVRAKFGIPDSKMRFRIDQPYRDVEIRVGTHTPSVTVQWVRLATADEATWHHYFNMGGRDSVLGYPIGPFLPAPESRYGSSGFGHRFECGSIYYTTRNGPCEVFGDGLAQFNARGGILGELGYPISRPRPGDRNTVVQDFEGGTLRWEAG